MVTTFGLSSFVTFGSSSSGCGCAAPAAAALLADWGADVIKVEAPTGDPMRNVFGSIGIGSDLPNPAFALDNRGKRSVVLDLREPDDRPQLEELLETADVFVTNLRPDALDKLGLEPAATVNATPISCTAASAATASAARSATARPTTSGPSGPGRDFGQMADADGNPLNARGGVGDHITGLAALAGILAAVLEQRATGRGRVVEVSLLRTGAYVLGWDLGLQLALGKVAGAEPRHKNQAPLMNPYRTADGQWFFLTGLEAGRHIGAVCRALAGPTSSTTRASPMPRASAGTGPRSSPSSTSLVARAHPGRVGGALRGREGSGGRRRRRRPRWWRTRSSWPTTASWRWTAARSGR